MSNELVESDSEDVIDASHLAVIEEATVTEDDSDSSQDSPLTPPA